MCYPSNIVIESDTKSFLHVALVIGGLHEDKSSGTLQARAPINDKTVHQTYLFHIVSNLDRLRLVLPTHGQRSQQQSGQITLQSVLIDKRQAQVSRGHKSCRNKKKMIYEVHGGGGLELVKPAREPASSRPKPCAYP